MGSQAQDGITSVVANVVMMETIILGTITIPSVAVGSVTYHFRLLELLNNPRIGSRQTDRIRESIVLTDVYVLPKTGPKIAVARELFVRPESIICAYEYEGQRKPVEVDFNPSLSQKPERVVIVTTNGLQLEGTFLGGVGALAAPKQKRFLPLVDVVLSHTDQLTTRLSVPFVAVNNDAIAAFTPGEGEPR